MVITILWISFIVFLIYMVIQIGRLRAEDPGLWPEHTIPTGHARFRLHPAWLAQRRGDALEVAPGVERARLRIETIPAVRASAATERLVAIVQDLDVVLDAPDAHEGFFAGEAPGARIASAATTTEGERRWMELHLVRGPDTDLLFTYRGPVLSGPYDSLTLSRAVGTARFGPAATGETVTAAAQ